MRTTAPGICICDWLKADWVYFPPSLSMHCAWLLAVASELLWQFVVFHTLCVGTRALSSALFPCPHAVCGWDACLLGVRVSALLRETLVPQPCGHHSRGEALLRRAFRPPSARCH